MTIRRTLWLVACAILLTAAFTYGLGGYSLLDPDEGRNAEIAREMAVTNDYMLPRLNGVPYVDKPVLYFAAGALVMELLGPTVASARLPSLLFAVGTLGLVAWFAGRTLGSAAAWIAAIATAATPFMLAYARTVIFDTALTLFVVGALVGFYLAVEESSPRQPPSGSGTPDRPGRRWGSGERAAWWRAAAWGALALGVLTKGPVALAVPLMVVLPYAVWRRRWRALADPIAVLLFAAIVMPWLFVMAREVPSYLEYVVVTETASRLTTRELERWGPFWYFLAIFPAAALPWSVVAAAAWRGRRTGNGEGHGSTAPLRVFLLLWLLVPLLFFTLSQSKRPQYVLPMVPAVGLLVAVLWHAAGATESGGGRVVPGVRVAGGALFAMSLAFVAGATVIPRLVPASPAVAAAIPPTAVALGIVCLIAGTACWPAARRWDAALLVLALPVAAIPFVGAPLLREIGRDRSAAEIAEAVDHVLTPATEVIGVHVYPPSLPFYLRRTITLATDDGVELTSNYVIRHFNEVARLSRATVRSGDWWRQALFNCDRPRIFVAASRDRVIRETLAARLALLAETRKYAVYGPCAVGDLAAVR